MTLQDPRLTTAAATAVGSALLSELPDDESALIHLLRRWDTGTEGQAAAIHDLVATLGRQPAIRATIAIEGFLDLLLVHPRRVLHRQRLGCHCASADERSVAMLVTAATHGRREEAMMVAFGLVRADCAAALVQAGEQMGLALGLTLGSGIAPSPRGRGLEPTLH